MIADPEPLRTYTWLARELNRRSIGFLHIYCQSADWIHDAPPNRWDTGTLYGGAAGGYTDYPML